MGRFRLVLLLGGLLAALPAQAQSLADEIVRQMTRQGFRDIDIAATWLGRTRITGTRNGGSREIIVNPNTGEILRDLWLNADGQVRAADIDLEADDDAVEDAADRLDTVRDAVDDARDDARDNVKDAVDAASDDSSGKGSGRGADSDSGDDSDSDSSGTGGSGGDSADD